MVRLATVGSSDITQKFLSACRVTNRFVFKTAYSRDIKRAQEFSLVQGFEGFTDDIYALARDPDIDAVYIATPNVFHYEQSKLFLKNGKNVICEKPITNSLAEYNELLELSRKNKLIYMEAIMSRHCMGRRILKDAIEKIGNITMARLDFCQLSSRYERFLSGEKVNIFDMSLGAGVLTDLGVYCVYSALDLLGVPNNIKASASFLENGADGMGSAIFDYNKFLAVLSYSKIGQGALGSEIVGDKGAVKIKYISQYAGITLVKDGVKTELLGLPSRDEVMSGEAEKFADYIENFEQFKADYALASELSYNVHKCMDSIKQKANIKYNLTEYRLN